MMSLALRIHLLGATAALSACQAPIVDVAEAPVGALAAPEELRSKVAWASAGGPSESEPAEAMSASLEASVEAVEPVSIEPTTERCVERLTARAPTPPPSDEVCPTDPGRPSLAVASLAFRGLATTVTVELASTPTQRERGLMYRRRLEEDRGMLFVFGDRRVRSFWMRNTCIPLDILFLDEDGLVVGIVEQAAPHTDDSREVGCASKFVLEVPGGWTRRHGVKPGMIAVLPQRAEG